MGAAQAGVVIYTSVDQPAVERLADALRKAGLSPDLTLTSEGCSITLPAEEIARGAQVLAQLERHVPVAQPTPIFPPAPPPPVQNPLQPAEVLEAIEIDDARRARANRGPKTSRLLAVFIFVGTAAAMAGFAMTGAATTGGRVLAVGLLLGLSAQSLGKFGDPRANRLGLMSFAGMATSMLLANASPILGLGRVAEVLGGFACGLLTLASGGLAIAGLIQGYSHPTRYRVGRGYAWVSLGMLGLVLCSALVALVHRLEPSLAANSKPGMTVVEVQEKNFRYHTPPSPWVELDAKKVSPDATLAFMRAAPETYAVIIAERGVGATPDQALEFWRGRLTSRSPGAQFQATEPVTIAGLRGMLGRARATIGGTELAYLNASVGGRGYLYQFTLWAKPSHEDGLRAALDTITKGFELIDPKASAEPLSRAAGKLESTYGYSIELGSPWVVPSDAARKLPSAEYAAQCHGASTLVVMPFPLFGENVPAALLEDGLAQRMGVAREDANATRTRIRRGAFEGVEVRGTNVAATPPTRHHLLLLHDGKVGILAAQTWTQGDANESACPDQLDAIRFGTAAPSAGTNPARAARSAVLFANLAEMASQDGDAKRAQILARKALVLAPTDVMAANAVVHAAERAGQRKSALPMLDAAVAHAPESAAVRAVRAELLQGMGQTAAALEAYRRLFAAGYEDDSALTAYAHLLEGAGKRNEALQVVAAYRQHRDSGGAAVLEAALNVRQGEPSKAITVLEAYRKEHASDADASGALIRLYRQQARAMDAMHLSEALLAEGQHGPEVYLDKAETELALKWYPRAKQTAEEGLRQHPGDEDLQHLLARLDSYLGKGNSAPVKDPIPPVALPEELTRGAPHLADTGHRAVYELNGRAISVEPGKDLRSTEYIRVRIVDEAGVQLFSTLSFDFDPLAESLYLDQLQVLDEKGKVVARGSPDDQYVSDRASEAKGTQRRTLFVPVPALRPGQTLSYALTRRWSNPDAPTYEEFPLVASEPVERNVLYVRGALSALRHFERGVSARAVAGGLAWTVDGTPPIEAEPFALPIEELAPTVWLGDAKTSWEGELGEYLDSIKGLLAPDPQLAATSKRLTAGAQSEQDRIRELARFVQHEVTYRAIEFGRGARIPRPAGESLTHRYGDCKDEALLLHQLLQAAGIRSVLAVVRTSGPVQREVPSLDQFDHMIVVVPGTTPLFLDSTEKGAEPLGPPPWLAGRDVLLVQPGPPVFLTIHMPDPPPAPEVAVTREVAVDAEGNAEVTERVALRGSLASSLRDFFQSLQPDRRAERLGTWLSDQGAHVTVKSLKLEDLERTDRPLGLQVQYSARGQFHTVGDQLVGPAPLSWERFRIRVEALPERKTDFEVRLPFTLTSDTTLQAPKGYAFAAGHGGEAREAFGTWSLTAQPVAGGMHLAMQYRRQSGRHAKDAYPHFERNARDALEALGQTLALQKR